MIHEAALEQTGKTAEALAEARELERLNRHLLERMSRNCGKRKDFFTKYIHERGNVDVYLTARQAKELGIANHVRIPLITVEVSVSHAFR